MHVLRMHACMHASLVNKPFIAFTCSDMSRVPWKSFLTSPLTLSKPKHEYDHKGPQFLTWKVKSFSRWIFIVVARTPVGKVLWQVYMWLIGIRTTTMQTYHTEWAHGNRIDEGVHLLWLVPLYWYCSRAVWIWHTQGHSNAGSTQMEALLGG